MTDRLYAVELGQDLPENIVKSVNPTATAYMNLRWTFDAVGSNKTEAVKALNAIRDFILQDAFPPT